MKINTKSMTIVATMAIMAVSCGQNRETKLAETLLEKAETEWRNRQYDNALLTIDSLRKAYPNAIEARKKALKMYQDIALEQAQADLAATDTMLQRANKEYETMKMAAEQAKAQLKATPEQLQQLTLKRMERDSLQVRFDVQCAKIKYIHKRQKE